MKLARFRTAVGGATLGVLLAVGSVGSVFAAPGQPSAPQAPKTSFSSGVQTKPPIAPGSRDAKASARLGDTQYVQTDSTNKVSATSLAAGTVANVDFQTPLNYCWRSLSYTPVSNTTSSTKYLQVRVYNQGTYHDIYTSVAANSTAYPAFYGVTGDYTAYLYVWNGSSYQYDEYRSSNNTCNVSVSRVYNTGGWVELKIQNLGTAYASQQSTELAPFPGSGTYTGTQYDYPTAGGAAIYRWFWVSTSPYGISSHTLGSFSTPTYFTGDL